jgi:hypothetical protein
MARRRDEDSVALARCVGHATTLQARLNSRSLPANRANLKIDEARAQCNRAPASAWWMARCVLKDTLMKTAHVACALFTGLALFNCGGPAPDAGGAPASLVRPGLVTASSETTVEVGVVSWEVVRDQDRARVFGRNDKDQILVNVAWQNNPRACEGEGGAVVTTTATLPAAGSKSIGCGGQVIENSLDPLTGRAIDLLFADIGSLTPADVETRQPQGFSQPPPPGGPFANPTPGYCAPHTSTHCYGVVERCTDTFANCTTNSRICGVCFGIW